jgi:hypothetical protein
LAFTFALDVAGTRIDGAAVGLPTTGGFRNVHVHFVSAPR